MNAIRPRIAAALAALLFAGAAHARTVPAGNYHHGPHANNLRPRESWAAFRKLTLSPAEFAHIAANVPPYFPDP